MKSEQNESKSLFSIVNISVKRPISENHLAKLIRSGVFRKEYYAHIFAFFTELPLNTLLSFIRKYKLSLSRVAGYYKKNVKKYYRNPSLEEYFKDAG